jgi:ubiquitin-conjugating enzyme E2 Q
MDEPLPVGLGLRVPPPFSSGTTSSQPPDADCVHNAVLPLASTSKVLNLAADGLCEFDDLDLNQVRISSYLLV